MIRFENIYFRYPSSDAFAVRDTSLNIDPGCFVGLIGVNGSGKSTLVRLINGLQLPTHGTLSVDGIVLDRETVWDIRQLVSIVFSNPDNQIVGATVFEDVSFGLENLGLAREDVERLANEALATIGIEVLRDAEPHLLSGGQKQLAAVAGAIAITPKYLILDEAAAMLDKKTRRSLIEDIIRLARRSKMTIIYITHFLEDLIDADRILMMAEGRVVADGSNREILTDCDRLRRFGLEPPKIAELTAMIDKSGIEIDRSILSQEEFIDELCRRTG